MKLNVQNIVLLCSCFGIAFEFSKLMNQNNEQPVKIISQPAPNANTQQWLRSDGRKQMEEVAKKQGWIQFIDGSTQKPFWYCPATNESFYELVFVGSNAIHLNRWCNSQTGTEEKKNRPAREIPRYSNKDQTETEQKVLVFQGASQSRDVTGGVYDGDDWTFKAKKSEVLKIGHAKFWVQPDPNESSAMKTPLDAVAGQSDVSIANDRRISDGFQLEHKSSSGPLPPPLPPVLPKPQMQRPVPLPAPKLPVGSGAVTKAASAGRHLVNPLSPDRSRGVFFLHLHKAAGTTLCEMAVRNKMKAAGIKSIGTKEVGGCPTHVHPPTLHRFRTRHEVRRC
jgi:hypothetical protein